MFVEQVAFRQSPEEKFLGGIMINKTHIICGECGGVLEVGEDVPPDQILPYPDWVDISDSIVGGELPQ